MSEHHQPQHEKAGEHLKPVEHKEHDAGNHERELTSAEKQHGSEKHVEHLSRHVEQHAVSGKELAHGEHENNHQAHPVLVNKQLKEMAYHRAMTRTRKKLSPVSRGFSKLVHVQAIDRSSEFIGKTVARPAAMLWGAIFAFAGTSALLWITRHYGYEYNYLLAILLFVGGAILGTVLEGLWYLLKRKN